MRHMSPHGRLLQREFHEQRIDVAKQHRICIRENDYIGIAGGNAKPPICRSVPVEFGEYLVRHPLPGNVEVLAPLILTANSVEIAMIADNDQQPGVAILRAVQTAEGEVVQIRREKRTFLSAI